MTEMVKKEQKNIDTEITYNEDFVIKRESFYQLCKVCINPEIKYADIDEMMRLIRLALDLTAKDLSSKGLF